MGDEGDFWRDVKEIRQEKRASNRVNGQENLTKEGIPFEIKNNGAHLIVEGNSCFIDYWPGTGRWNSRDGVSGFGVRSLIHHIKFTPTY
jgi:hypothetical protein